MNNTKPLINGHLQINDLNRFALCLFVLVAVAISWIGVLDNYAEDYIKESILDAGIIYGISRAINATVSVAQSVEIDAVIVSVTVGEFLDPVNDLIERFSEVMTVSITSLAMQKILLLVANHEVFNFLITLSGAALVAAMFLKRGESRAFKAFTILVLIRSSLLIVLLSNNVVDKLLLQSQIEEGTQKIELLKDEVESIADKAKNGDSLNENAIELLDDEIIAINSEKEQIADDISSFEKKINEEEMRIDIARDEAPWWLPDILNDNPMMSDAKNSIAGYEDQIEIKIQRLDDLENKISSLEEQRKCAEKQRDGESCSWWGLIPTSGEGFNKRLINAADVLKDKTGDVLTLMALVILRSILLPLLFWVLIYKAVKWIWRKEFHFSQA
jgi:hypothetical protein